MHSLPALTFHAMIENSARLFAERPALTFVNDKPLTYSDVRNKIAALQSLMTSLGVVQGDRVALLSQNMPHWGVAYLAITGMGAVVVPILIDFHAADIKNILTH
jgi:long-chain acyl-CoA synthetase